MSHDTHVCVISHIHTCICTITPPSTTAKSPHIPPPLPHSSCTVSPASPAKIWIRHVTYERVMSYSNMLCRTWMRHVTQECIISHMHTCVSRRIYIYVMSHMNASGDTRMCHATLECVMSHMNAWYHICIPASPAKIWMSHVMHECIMWCSNVSCHTWTSHVIHEWVISYGSETCHTGMSHVTHDCSRHTRMSHVTYGWVMSHTHGWVMWYTKTRVACVSEQNY